MKIPENIKKKQTIETTIVDISMHDSLSGLIQIAIDKGWKIEDVFVDVEYGYQGDPDVYTLVGRRLETDEEVQARIDVYVANYNARMAEIEKKAQEKLAKKQDKEWKEYQRLKKKFG